MNDFLTPSSFSQHQSLAAIFETSSFVHESDHLCCLDNTSFISYAPPLPIRPSLSLTCIRMTAFSVESHFIHPILHVTRRSTLRSHFLSRSFSVSPVSTLETPHCDVRSPLWPQHPSCCISHYSPVFYLKCSRCAVCLLASVACFTLSSL